MRVALALGRINDQPRTAAHILGQVRDAERAGFDSVWISHLVLVQGFDGVTLAAAAAVQTDRIRIGTFVPFLLSHPALVAHRALTLQALSGGRSMICLIATHRALLERALGVEYGDPVKQLVPYLDVLLPLLRQQPVRRLKPPFPTRIAPDVPRATPPEVLLTGTRRSLVEMAAARCDGVNTTMAGRQYLAQEVIPVAASVAREADSPPPRILAHCYVSVTDEPDAARDAIHDLTADLHLHPVYERMLAVDRVTRVADVSLVGSASVVSDMADDLAKLGVTDLLASIPEVPADSRAYERTYDWLASRARASTDAAAAYVGARG